MMLYDVELTTRDLDPPFRHIHRFHSAKDAQARLEQVRSEIASGDSSWTGAKRLPGFRAPAGG